MSGLSRELASRSIDVFIRSATKTKSLALEAWNFPVERWMPNGPDTQIAKSCRLRAARIKELAAELPDSRDQQALAELAMHFLEQANEFERRAKLRARRSRSVWANQNPRYEVA